MNNALLDIVDKIMDMLEEKNFEAYTYDNRKFHIIDKNNNIDFQAKLGNNNYYFKDNISGLSYIKTKKYINDNTTIQQMVIEENDEKCFYSYLERNGYVCLVRAIRIDGDDTLVCNNYDVINHRWEDIEQYADDCFDDTSDMDEVKAVEFTPDVDFLNKVAKEDENIKKEFGYIYEKDDSDNDDERDDEYYDEDEYENDEYEEDDDDEDEIDEDDEQYEFNQIEENERSGLSDMFEQNSIHDYETYIERKQECEESGESYNQKEDNLPIGGYSAAIAEYYQGYELTVNGKKVEGIAKCRIIGDCEAAVDEKAYDSAGFDQAAINLIAVLTALQKEADYEK